VNLARIGHVTVANLKMLVRNRTAVFFSLVFPIMFMVIFGLIFGKGNAQRSDLDVVGKGPLVAALAHSGAVKLHPRPSAPEAIKRVKDGKEAGALVVRGRDARLYFSNTDLVAAAQLQGIVRGTADAVALRAAHARPQLEVTMRSVDADKLSYIDFLVPGLIAMALSQSAVFGVAGSLVSFRERGIFRRLRVTPLPLTEFAIGRVASHLALALTQTAVLLTVGVVGFGVNLNAYFIALVPLVVLGALAFIALGLLVGSVAKTQDSADAIANAITLPMLFLAGIFFPLDAAPSWLQAIAKVLPLTYLASGLRDVAIRGHSVISTAADMGVLALTALVVGAIALRFFRWEPA
jgi:ABC-2 type transport system permease protein